MVESNFQQKYKVVSDPTSGNSWVKELNNPGSLTDTSATRHQINVGPRGGQTFVNNNGKTVNAKTVPNKTEVWPADSVKEAPPSGETGFGFGNKSGGK